MQDSGNVVAAFSEDDVLCLTNLSKNRLRNWDTTGFFHPAFASENRREAYSRVYSFKDIASLRVLAELRDHGVSLQHLREVSAKLRDLGEDRWLKVNLYVKKKRIILVDASTEPKREFDSKQTLLMHIPLYRVWTMTMHDVEQLFKRNPEQRGKLTKHRNVAHNATVISGTRIPVSTIKEFRDAGYTPAQIIAEYPDLTLEDIEVALNYDEKRAA